MQIYPDRQNMSTSVAASSAVHWSRHIGKGVDKLAPQRLLDSLVKPKVLFRPPESRWDRWRAHQLQSPRSPGPFPFFSGSSNGFIPEEVLALRRSSAASLSSREGMVKVIKLPNFLQHWQAMRPGNTSIPLRNCHAARAIAQGVFWIRKWETWLAHGSTGLLRSLTNFSIIPKNVVRASSTRTTSHFWAQRSGNAQYMYFKVRVFVFFPWNPSKPTRGGAKRFKTLCPNVMG